MILGRAAVLVGISLATISGCREEVPLSSNNVQESPPPVPAPFQQRLAFSTTGLQTSSRLYTNIHAGYDENTATTTIETGGDSLTSGKFVMRLHGGRTGLYRYSVRGTAGDIDEIDMRFVSQYEGSLPLGVFALTGNPFDSLDAQVTISKFGGVGDSIIGYFGGQLKMVDPPMQFKIFLFNGEFKVQRLE